jgi:hypothetical protein
MPINNKRRDIYNQVFEDGFGLVNLGNHRGLFFGNLGEQKEYMRGWLYCTPEFVKSAEQLRGYVKEYLEDIKLYETKVKE